MNCPCNHKTLYELCCSKAHKDITTIETAEQLMRSRYSAFAMDLTPFLQLSHHTSTKPSNRQYKKLRQWMNSVSWLALEIINTNQGHVTDHKGYVTFKASYYENGTLQVILERSEFCKENGHWVYLKGEHF